MTLTQKKRDELLDQIAGYAEQVEGAEQEADRDSLVVAEALTTLYEDKKWVDEYQEVKPAKPDVIGRTDPESRNRFAAWLVWKEGERSKHAPHNRRVYQLFDAAALASRLHNVQTVPPATEGQVRPFKWFLTHDLQDDIPKVWRRAVEIAEGPPTMKHVMQARAEYRKAMPEPLFHKVIKAQRAHVDRVQAELKVKKLFEDGEPAEIQAFHDWYKNLSSEYARQAKSA